MKRIIIAFCLLLSTDFAFCQNVKLLDATYRVHNGGPVFLKDTASTVPAYRFKIQILTAQKITFDSVWAGNRGFDADVTPEQFSKNDAITIDPVSIMNEKDSYRFIKAPKKYNKKGALIRYKINGKSFYFAIDSMRQLPDYK